MTVGLHLVRLVDAYCVVLSALLAVPVVCEGRMPADDPPVQGASTPTHAP